MDSRTNSIGIVALIALAGIASGQIRVDHNSGGGFTEVTGNTAFVVFPSGTASGNNLELITQSGTYRIRTTTPASDDIGEVTYHGTGAITVLISASDGATDSGTALSNGANDWAGLVGSGTSNIILQAALTGGTTGPITAGNIVRLDIDGDVGDDASDLITVDPLSGTPTLARVESTAGNINASIVVEQGTIGDVVAVTGSILGDVWADTGTIGRVFADTAIGSSGSPVMIYAGANVSSATGSDRVTIRLVGSLGDIYADIVASPTAAEQGRFGWLIANTGANINDGISGA